tara:strand:- start:162 stop:1094 length:933 start_codon:yes stop_codon:yes gene_type:complete
MKRTLRNVILYLVAIPSLFISCQSNQDKTKLTERVVEELKEKILNTEEQEIIAVVENILRAAGNYNIVELDNLTSDKAVIGYTRIKDGTWKNTEVTINEYFESIKNRELRPFIEIVSDYDIIVTEEHMALVRADAVVNRFGIPGSREVNHMILIKENNQWKLLSIGWTAHKQPEEKRKFDLNIFAQGYAQAWGSTRPEFIAMFFEEDGSLTVNNGKPAKGTTAIINVAQSFMETFPDMIVSMDSLITKSNKTRFYWTLTGTNDIPNGTGNKVKISGFEEWTLNKDGLIQESKGYFDEKEYQRQLENGTDK